MDATGLHKTKTGGAQPQAEPRRFFVDSLRRALLRRRQLGDELGQLRCRRALGGADVIAAGRDAGTKTFFQREPQYPAKAEAGVEVVAGPGADPGLLDER